MHYLSVMSEEQTLVMCSGHPQGLFPSAVSSPRMVITNGLVRTQEVEWMHVDGGSMGGRIDGWVYLQTQKKLAVDVQIDFQYYYMVIW